MRNGTAQYMHEQARFLSPSVLVAGSGERRLDNAVETPPARPHSATRPDCPMTCRSRFIRCLYPSLLFGVGVVLLLGAPPVAAQSCSFDGQIQVDPEQLAEGGAVQGNPEADLLLVEFFDPNCPHCRRFHPVMKQVMEAHGDEVRLYKHPLPLGQFSINQIRGLLLAQQKGAYYEMVDAQLTSPHAGKDGMTIDQVVALAEDIGLDPTWMRTQLNDSSVMRAQVRRLMYNAQKAGIRSTPTLAVGRKAVVGPRSAECIGRLVEQELKAEGEEAAEGE